MDKIELEIVALSHSVTQSHNYAVVLGEIDGERRLPVVIGGFEAQAIAVAMENMKPSRPLTHDLFKNTLDAFKINMKEVVINNLLDGVFYAKLVCEMDGVEYDIDSRTSDAIAMAVRYSCPIYTFPFILESAGVILDDDKTKGRKKVKAKSPMESMSSMSIHELNNMLNKVLANEDYEQAAMIRDEINKREFD